MRLRNLRLITIVLWVAIATALGYWRIFYAWHLGAGYVFFFYYIPILTLILITALSFEYFYFRKKD